MTSEKTRGYALGALFAGISLACAILVYAAPGLASLLLEYLTHSTWQFSIQPFDPVKIAIGALVWGVIGFATGWIFSMLKIFFNS